MQELTQDRLKELLHYDQETGVFTWLVATNGRIKVGSAAGTVNRDGYLRAKIDKKNYMLHRVAYLYVNGAWPEHEVDHKDLNKTNNSWKNLRQATHAQNVKNRAVRKDSLLGIKGVTQVGGRFKSMVQVNGKRTILGTYGTPEEAHAAYTEAANC